MRILILSMLVVTVALSSSNAQSKEENEVLNEGIKLYKTEMASWVGTDIFLEKFSHERQSTGGYFSYLLDSFAVCVFFSKGDDPKIIASFKFDSTYNSSTVVIDSVDREMTVDETDLLTIRQNAIALFKTDALFKSFKDTNPNFIPLSDENGKRVYILTGPQKQGVVIFGGDYLVKFDDKNRLKERKAIHKSIIPIEYGNEHGKQAMSTMHTHLPETGDLITPSDICTLLLYQRFTTWESHFVVSSKKVSIWNCKTSQLGMVTKKAWDKIYRDQQKK